MGPRAAPALEAFRSWAGCAPGPIQEASLPAGCPACPGLPRPAAAGPPLASSPRPVGSGAVHPPPCVHHLQGHLRETGRPTASAGDPPALPQGSGRPLDSPRPAAPGAPACRAPALPAPAGWPQAPRAVWMLPAPPGADWGLQTREAGGELPKPGLHTWGGLCCHFLCLQTRGGGQPVMGNPVAATPRRAVLAALGGAVAGGLPEHTRSRGAPPPGPAPHPGQGLLRGRQSPHAAQTRQQERGARRPPTLGSSPGLSVFSSSLSEGSSLAKTLDPAFFR